MPVYDRQCTSVYDSVHDKHSSSYPCRHGLSYVIDHYVANACCDRVATWSLRRGWSHMHDRCLPTKYIAAACVTGYSSDDYRL